MKFISFYSFDNPNFSFSARRIAEGMAAKGKKILVIDGNLEVPTLSMSFSSSFAGFTNILLDCLSLGAAANMFNLKPEKFLKEYVLTKNNVDYLSAGVMDEKYPNDLDKLNINRVYEDGMGEPLIRAFKQVITNSKLYDFVFIISGFGFSSWAGIVNRDLTDGVVILSFDNFYMKKFMSDLAQCDENKKFYVMKSLEEVIEL